MHSIVFQREGRKASSVWESTAATEHLAIVFRGVLPRPLIATTQAISAWQLNLVSIHAQHPGALSPFCNARDWADWAVDLNNFLQEHADGNLTPSFHYAMTRERSGDNDIHIARAMCKHRFSERNASRPTDCPPIVHDTCCGEGRGRRTGVAKREAARQALEYFRRNGVPGHTG